jgi:chromosome segregation ATPase
MYTEQDMRQYFEGLISQFVSLSAQAKELEELKGRVSETETAMARLNNDNYELRQTIATTRRECEDYMHRVERLDQDNNRLKSEVEDAQALANSYSADASNASNGWEEAKREIERLVSILRERDATIERLEGEQQRLKEDIVGVRSERDVARTEAEGYRVEKDRVSQELTVAQADASYWHNAFDQVKAKLDHVTEALRAA